MQTVVLTIHLILALMLIGLVLMQRSEGGGLGIGGGGNQATGRQGATAMTRATWIVAGAFIMTSITLTIFATQDSSGRSVIDGSLPVPTTESGNDLVPNTLGEDLLPPSPTDEPAAPPRAE